MTTPTTLPGRAAPLGATLTYSTLVVDRDGRLMRPYTTGEGRWRLSETATGTHVRYEWNVRTTEWWMNLLSPIARPEDAAKVASRILEALGRPISLKRNAEVTSGAHRPFCSSS